MMDGKHYWCKNCVKEKYANDRGKTINQIQKHNQHKYSGKMIDGMKICSICNEWKSIDNYTKTYMTNCGLFSSCKNCNSLYQKAYKKILKMEFILAYGGCCQCKGCGEHRLDFLTVEHIRDGKHKLIKCSNSWNLMSKLKALGWPEGYTVLCYNCNCSQNLKQPCLHTKEYKDYEIQLENSIQSDMIRDKYFKLKNQLGYI